MYDMLNVFVLNSAKFVAMSFWLCSIEKCLLLSFALGDNIFDFIIFCFLDILGNGIVLISILRYPENTM